MESLCSVSTCCRPGPLENPCPSEFSGMLRCSTEQRHKDRGIICDTSGLALQIFRSGSYMASRVLPGHEATAYKSSENFWDVFEGPAHSCGGGQQGCCTSVASAASHFRPRPIYADTDDEANACFFNVFLLAFFFVSAVCRCLCRPGSPWERQPVSSSVLCKLLLLRLNANKSIQAHTHNHSHTMTCTCLQLTSVTL